MKTRCFTPKVLLLLLLTFILIQISQADAIEVPRITPRELNSKLEQKADVIIADARGENSFEQERIKDAISMPLGEVEARYKELPREKEIVFYCT